MDDVKRPLKVDVVDKNGLRMGVLFVHGSAYWKDITGHVIPLEDGQQLMLRAADLTTLPDFFISDA